MVGSIRTVSARTSAILDGVAGANRNVRYSFQPEEIMLVPVS
jgi:hypothetical protein